MGYDVFLSYSHSSDARLAPAIRDGLQKLAKPWNRRRALNVFLDKTSLEVSSGLKDSLKKKLADTKWLVLLLSEDSARSPWVGEEIASWASGKPAETILLVHTGGELHWGEGDFDWERSTAAPQALSGLFEEEPLWLDLRWARDEPSLDIRSNLKFRDELATLAAPLHGTSKEELVGEDLRQFRRSKRLRRLAITGLFLLTVTSVLAGGVAWLQRNEAIRQRDQANARRLAAVANQELGRDKVLALLLSLASLDTVTTPEGVQALGRSVFDPKLIARELGRHAKEAQEVAFDPGGSLLASAGSDGAVLLWDPAGGEARHRLDHGGVVTGLEFHPDGGRLATSSWDGRVRVWDTATGAALAELPVGSMAHSVAWGAGGSLLAAGGEGRVWLWRDLAAGAEEEHPGAGGRVARLAFSPDGRRLAGGGWQDTTAFLYQLDSGEILRLPHTENVSALAFDSGGRRLAVAAGSVRVWDAEDGSLLQELPHPRRASAVAFSPDGNSIATGDYANTVRLGRLGDPGWPALRLRPDSASASDLIDEIAFSPDGRRLASAGSDGALRLWSAEGRLLSELLGHTGQVFDLAFSPDGGQIASAGQDTTVRLWDASGGLARRTGTGPATEMALAPDGAWLASGRWAGVALIGLPGFEELRALRGATGEVTTVAVGPRGARLAAAERGGTVRVWAASTGALEHELRGHDKFVRALAFDPTGERLASGSYDGTALLWDAGSGELVRRLAGENLEIFDLAFSPDGALLAVATYLGSGYRGIVRLYEPAGGELVRELLGHEAPVNGIAFNDDGSLLATASRDTTVRLWRPAGDTPIHRLEGHLDDVRAVAFSPGGRLLASAGKDRTVRLWNAATGELVHVLAGDARGTFGLGVVAFSPDGGRVAAAGDGGAVRLWDTATGDLLAELAHPQDVRDLAFTPDGAYVVASGGGGLTRWPVDRQAWVEAACRAAGRNLTLGEWRRHVSPELEPTAQCPQYAAAEADGSAEPEGRVRGWLRAVGLDGFLDGWIPKPKPAGAPAG